MKAGPLMLSLLIAGCAATPVGPPGVVVAFGDSYTEGYGAREADAYPSRLAGALGRPVLNKGVTGETAGECARRLDRDVFRNMPDLVIVEFGVNEAFRGYPVSRSVADLDAMVARIQAETDAKVVLVGVHFWTFQEDFDAGLRDISERRGTGLVLDVLHGIVSSRRDVDDGDPRLRADDFHPNAAGYAIMAERIEPEVRRMLSRE